MLLGAVPCRADSERPGKVEEFNKACCPRDREVPSLTAWDWWKRGARGRGLSTTLSIGGLCVHTEYYPLTKRILRTASMFTIFNI